MTFKIGDRVVDVTLDPTEFEPGGTNATVVGKLGERIKVLWDDRTEAEDAFYDPADFRLLNEKAESPSGWSTDGNPLLTILEETTAKARQLIIEKGGEYAADTDVLANFRHEAGKLGLPMEVIWHIYIGKHLSAIDRYVRDIKDGKTDRPRMETLESRADDIITYMIHFKMMLKERNK